MKKMSRFLSFLLVLILCLSVLPLSAAADGYTGWQKIDGNWYYAENGAAAIGWKKIGNTWYYFVPDWGGVMLTGWLNTDPTFFSDSEGPFTGDWYHFSESGAMDANKWVKEDYSYEGTRYVDWYYMLGSGKGASGWQKIDGVWYYFEPDAGGVMLTGGPYNLGGSWYYFKDSGALFTGWKYLDFGENDRGWVYFTSNGAVIGWKKIDGKWYYFEFYMVTGLQEIDGKYYFFNDSGSLYTGWKKIPFGNENGDTWESWIYFTSNGALDGWQKIGGKWYCFENCEMLSGGTYMFPDGKYYCFNDDGSLYTGWRQSYNGKWVYFTVNGSVTDCWKKIGGKWYQFDEYGYLIE